MTKRVHLSVVAVALLLVASRADARPPFRFFFPLPAPYPFYYPYYNPGLYPSYPMYYSPYASGTYGTAPYVGADPYGGYLKGAAEGINAQGQFLKSTQEAYLLKEQVKAAELQNRRKAYENWLWERANTPTLNERRERSQREEGRRAQNDPPLTEVWSAKSLNDLLTSIQDLRNKGIEGPQVLLDAEVLKSINVTTGKGPGNPGLLKEAGPLKWPTPLRMLEPAEPTKELRTQIDALLADGKRQALVRGRVDPGLAKELERNIEALRKHLGNRINELSLSDYSESKRFLSQLDDAVAALQQPDAANYISGKYSARGATVKELVTYLSDNGLRFAPATGGEEGAYAALQQALAQYTAAVAKQAPAR
jgi:hypothetical protein